ncbi:MAG TPA: hypothetical protein VL442_09775 [Mucilaginibacter sp.]|jgi:hypothetical protein|nr:hypothetical protein [Mucilaginibacter sp.]
MKRQIKFERHFRFAVLAFFLLNGRAVLAQKGEELTGAEYVNQSLYKNREVLIEGKYLNLDTGDKSGLHKFYSQRDINSILTFDGYIPW